VLGVDDAALLLMAGVATLTLVVLAFAWRPLVLECFDPAFGQAVGARGSAWHLGFLAMLVLNLVAAFAAMGTLMAVGVMMLSLARMLKKRCMAMRQTQRRALLFDKPILLFQLFMLL
jgi:ABC-type Mn2+/Zn2+ transport system permease subunit